MFIRPNLKIRGAPREFGFLNLVGSVLNMGASIYGSYMQKEAATRARRLERAIAGQQLALQERAIEAESAYQQKVLDLEERQAMARIESDRIELEYLMSNPTPLETSGAFRIEPQIMQETLGVRGQGYYSQLPSEEEVIEASLMGRLGLPEKIMGLSTEYALMGGGLILLLGLTRSTE